MAKTIQLESGDLIQPNGQKFTVSTLELIDKALDSSPGSGLSIADFRARAKVDKAISALAPSATTLELNDADFETLKKAVEPVHFVSRASVIKNLINTLFEDDEDTNPLKSV